MLLKHFKLFPLHLVISNQLASFIRPLGLLRQIVSEKSCINLSSLLLLSFGFENIAFDTIAVNFIFHSLDEICDNKT